MNFAPAMHFDEVQKHSLLRSVFVRARICELTTQPARDSSYDTFTPPL